MKLMAVAAIAGLLLVGATGVRAGTTPTTQPSSAKTELVRQELQDLKADIAALRTARQSHDKAAVRAALEKIKADWAALPPKVKERVEKNHPKLFALLKELKERHENAAAHAANQG